jgi:arylsulfatase A-like enzyme
MIWRYPGVTAAGARIRSMMESVDIAATLPELCRLPQLETADGLNIEAYLAGRDEPLRNVAVTEFPWSKSIQKGRWRMVWYPKEFFAQEYPHGYGQLYDLDEDPWEMRNLYFDNDYKPVVQELERDLFDRLVTTTRPRTGGADDPMPPSPQNRLRHTRRTNGQSMRTEYGVARTCQLISDRTSSYSTPISGAVT